MIRFISFKKIYFVISALVIVPGIVSLFLWKLNLSVDFTGGAIWETGVSAPDARKLEGFLGKKQVEEVVSVQSTGDKSYLIKFKPITEERKNVISDVLAKKYGEVKETRFETVGPILGGDLIFKTIIGVVLAALFILAYVAYQFKNKMYGISAILAMFHDSLVILGLFSIFGHFFKVEIDTLFVTAVLTILSFSVHDTVVVFDRIRELSRIYPKISFPELVDKAINETIVRSLNNSLTIIFMLLTLLLLGGVTTKWFVIALLIGTISGTYSSTFVAAPLLVVWKELMEKRKKWTKNG